MTTHIATNNGRGANAAAQHTPGPWVAQWSTRGEDMIKRGWHVFNEDHVDDEGCVCALDDDYDGNARTEANARLIAAAPAMLMALRELAEWDGPQYAAHRALQAFQRQARAAIAQATGQNA